MHCLHAKAAETSFLVTVPSPLVFTMRCYASAAQRYASAVYAVIVCLSVRPSDCQCLSVTSWSSTRMAKPRIT